MTAPERFAEKSDSLLHRGRRPYMTHRDISVANLLRCAMASDYARILSQSPPAFKDRPVNGYSGRLLDACSLWRIDFCKLLQRIAESAASMPSAGTDT
jgi:hypothetical protein